MLRIIREHRVPHREALRTRLAAQGFPVAQATLSRDIRDLRLVKVVGADGKPHYTAARGVGERRTAGLDSADAAPRDRAAHALWGGRFEDGLADEMEALNRSLDVDWRLWRYDVQGSRAWARGLLRAGILPREEARRIDAGLAEVATRLEALAGPAGLPEEDIHTVVERMLIAWSGT